MTPHRQIRTVHAPWLQIVMLCLFLGGCSSATTQSLKMNDTTVMGLRERALVSGDPMLPLVTECATSTACNDGLGDTSRKIDYVTKEVEFHYLLETQNSTWVAAAAGIPVSIGQGLFSWLATVASGAKSFL